MAQVIASLVANIGANITGFQKGASTVKGGMKDMAAEAEIAQKKTALLGSVVAATSALIVDSYKEYSQLSESIRDLSLVSGESAESTSRFIQVLDDYQLTAEDATAAAKKLKDNGLSPTIETLAMLSDQFRAIQDPAERMDFVYDKLGKSGAKYVNMLNQGSDALLANAAAINKNLIMSDLEIKMYEVGRLAIDEKVDSLTAFRVELGQNVGNVLAFAAAMERAYEIQGESTKEFRGATVTTKDFGEALNQAIAEQLNAADASTQYKDSLKEQEEAVKAAEKAAMELTRTNQEYLSTIGDVTQELNDQSIKLDEIREKYGEGSQEYADATAEFEDNTHRRMLAMLEEQLSIDGLSEKESTFLLEQGVKWGIYSEEAISAMAAIQRQVDAMERNIDININVHTNYSEAGQAALTAQLAGEKGYTPNGHATGGNFVIPSSYGTEGFSLGGGDTASGGEGIKITPRGKSGNEDVIAAIERNRISEERLAQLFEGAMLRMRQ